MTLAALERSGKVLMPLGLFDADEDARGREESTTFCREFCLARIAVGLPLAGGGEFRLFLISCTELRTGDDASLGDMTLEFVAAVLSDQY